MADPIIMLSTHQGSPDGIQAFWYVEGREYPTEDTPLSDDLSAVFIREGWAAPSDDFGDPASPEMAGPDTKIDPATETTAICGVMTSRGTPCQNRRPCRWHDRG